MSNNTRGIYLVISGMLIFSVQDVLIKLLSEDTSLFQILFFRSVIGTLFIIFYLKVSGQVVKLGTAYPVLSAIRGLLFFFGYSAFYFAQSKMPIANATVLFLVSPFFITIMSVFFFQSAVGIQRWVTMAIGFSGVVFISQPEFGHFNLFYLLPVSVAFVYGVSMMIAKHTADKDTVFQQIIFMYMVTTILSGLMGLGIGDGRFHTPELAGIQFMTHAWKFDELFTNSSILVLSVIGTVGFLLLHSAYRTADPATVTPFEYSGLLPAIFWGYLFWDNIPSLNEAIGMTLIVGAGIYLFYREKVLDQTTASESPLR
jgi:drug/metabolite transporter (DMT)-like permease